MKFHNEELLKACYCWPPLENKNGGVMVMHALWCIHVPHPTWTQHNLPVNRNDKKAIIGRLFLGQINVFLAANLLHLVSLTFTLISHVSSNNTLILQCCDARRRLSRCYGSELHASKNTAIIAQYRNSCVRWTKNNLLMASIKMQSKMWTKQCVAKQKGDFWGIKKGSRKFLWSLKVLPEQQFQMLIL